MQEGWRAKADACEADRQEGARQKSRRRGVKGDQEVGDPTSVKALCERENEAHQRHSYAAVTCEWQVRPPDPHPRPPSEAPPEPEGLVEPLWGYCTQTGPLLTTKWKGYA